MLKLGKQWLCHCGLEQIIHPNSSQCSRVDYSFKYNVKIYLPLQIIEGNNCRFIYIEYKHSNNRLVTLLLFINMEDSMYSLLFLLVFLVLIILIVRNNKMIVLILATILVLFIIGGFMLIRAVVQNFAP